MEMTPMRMNPDISAFNSRKFVKSPTEKKPTTGQKRISKRLKTFRFVMIQFFTTKAHICINNLCKLFDDISKNQYKRVQFFDKRPLHPPLSPCLPAGRRWGEGKGEGRYHRV
jgi:hypothetical protein